MPIDDLSCIKSVAPAANSPPSDTVAGSGGESRYHDANDQPREKLFDLKRDAEEWELRVRTGHAEESKVDRAEGAAKAKINAEFVPDLCPTIMTSAKRLVRGGKEWSRGDLNP
jgi:hypothetical protein